MRDGIDPLPTNDLVYLEREISYWTGPPGYQACAAGVEAARDYAARHSMDRVVVLPVWACRHSGALKDAVAQIDPAGLVTDCDGAKIVAMPTEESLERFVNWCKQHVRWEGGKILSEMPGIRAVTPMTNVSSFKRQFVRAER